MDSSYCEGDHQSPINIDTHNIVMDEHLDAFIYKHFDDKHSIEYITNTGHAGLTVFHIFPFFLNLNLPAVTLFEDRLIESS